jgi:hypothetical protein
MPSPEERQIYKMKGIYAIILGQLSNDDMDLLQMVAEFHHRGIKDTIDACLKSENPEKALNWWAKSPVYLFSLPSKIRTAHKIWTVKTFMLLKQHREAIKAGKLSKRGGMLNRLGVGAEKSYIFGSKQDISYAQSILDRDYPNLTKKGKHWWVQDKDDPHTWMYFFDAPGVVKGTTRGAVLVMLDLDSAQMIPNAEDIIEQLGPEELKTGSTKPKKVAVSKQKIKRLATQTKKSKKVH